MREPRVVTGGITGGIVPVWLVVAPAAALWFVMGLTNVAQVVARSLESPLPFVEGVSVYESVVDTTPVPITVTAASENIPLIVTRDQLLTDTSLWRRMHLADWNGVSSPLREQALDAMLVRYDHLILAPDRWERMTADDWDSVPQPVRVLTYAQMVGYWNRFYAVGRAYGLPGWLVSDTLTAIIMSESWFDHRAINVGGNGQSDLGLAQASTYARERMQQLYAAGVVDMWLSDEDYFNPWLATRFAAVWMALLIADTAADLDFAIRAYHRGVARAFDRRGDVYLAYVHRLRDRFIRNQYAPRAWDYLWRRVRDSRSWRATRLGITDRRTYPQPDQHRGAGRALAHHVANSSGTSSSGERTEPEERFNSAPISYMARSTR